ncbi:MAG: aromatic/alkene monooxygenase hydroxylase subunit beta [SAR324 cluster bacterium]|nr:aromatic/alkene monooxygenase hydroxylase subunit beta [SAR324 cluster bacterium]
MQVDIKTTEMKPIRNTYGHIAERFGDKPASRYQEATYDLQATDHFHYRPLWEPEKELIDESRTKLKMKDWYAFKDPRQFYYGTYVAARAKMNEGAEANFNFVDSKGLAEKLTDSVISTVKECILPLRHLGLSANMNNSEMTAKGFGTVTTQATMYYAMDHLGIAQYISRIGLVVDGNTGTSLTQAKALWMDAPYLQGLRRLAEDTLCCDDWFELFVAQNLVLDGMMYPLVYESIINSIEEQGGTAISMLTDFMTQWMKETKRWVDAEINVAAGESEYNKDLIQSWITKWSKRATEALAPLADKALGASGAAAMKDAAQSLNSRVAKCGLSL